MAGTDAATLQARAANTELEAVAARLRPRFRRRAAHRHAGAYLHGLLGEVKRTNGWQLAEYAGDRHPRTIQRVLDRSAWDPDEVRDAGAIPGAPLSRKTTEPRNPATPARATS